MAFGSRCPPCVAALPYEGVTRKALLAYKEHRAWGLAPFLSRALVIGCRAATSQRWWPLQKTRAGPAVVLVPVPASREAQRRRGGDHVLRVARMAAAELRLSGWTVAVWRALRVRGRPVDSVGLSAAARQRNRAGSFALRRHRIVSGWRRTGEQNGNASVVLVDDVMASGATLSEAASVLQDGDVTVMGSVVITAPR